jgi:hypothetical protein
MQLGPLRLTWMGPYRTAKLQGFFAAKLSYRKLF